MKRKKKLYGHELELIDDVYKEEERKLIKRKKLRNARRKLKEE